MWKKLQDFNVLTATLTFQGKKIRSPKCHQSPDPISPATSGTETPSSREDLRKIETKNDDIERGHEGMNVWGTLSRAET
ncbi:hypothetical protein D0Z07_6037 [Hyphodiscus hymeniophilus]|uniref:Uncharacterized protein n=1 Tax=Hyphodiscus hymeniophilus TaxID=353542 RepID=A0A9P6VI42_9HELO|nr:hypothetical protein D0Z07_6037 [Hyphodiscus hymeniophilus]